MRNAKYGIWIGAAALALLAAGAALRGGRDGTPVAPKDRPARAPQSYAAPAADGGSAGLIVEDGKASGLALKLAGRLGRIQAMEGEQRVLELPPTDDERSRLEAMKAEAQHLAELLAARLKAHPREWEDTLAILGSGGGLRTSTQALDLLRKLGGMAGERLLVQLLHEGSTPQMRRLAARFLRHESSTNSLNALVASAEGDEDPHVRMEAILSLLHRRGQAKSENARLVILETLRGRATADPDPGIRQYAGCLRLEPSVDATASSGQVPRPERRKTSRLTRTIKTNWAEATAVPASPQ